MSNKILDLVLMLLGFILPLIVDKREAARKFKEFVSTLEAKNDASDALDESDRQLNELKDKDA